MIPQRVKLSGFLSYKDEQEVRFDGSPLWMLSGTNGSGKSSIFDAVTFALFGHHRGGSQNAAELINKESNTLAVEFDFTVEKQLYRIKRTVRRQKSDKIASTQQVLSNSRSPATSAERTTWEPIPDTNYKAKFDAWVKDKIGLDYETFTSSVLLLQGKSEKLLDSHARGPGRGARADRGPGALPEAARQGGRQAARTEGRSSKAIANQLAGIREVSDEELRRGARRGSTSAEEARDAGAGADRRADGARTPGPATGPTRRRSSPPRRQKLATRGGAARPRRSRSRRTTPGSANCATCCRR